MQDTDSSLFSNKKILFLSDVHLGGFTGEEDERIEKELIHLIDYCENKRYQIVILGDLFDYWMEYPSAPPGVGQRLLERFRRYNQIRNQPTLYITGNHDNWTYDYLARQGFDIESESRSWSLNGKNILLLHGDGLNDRSFHLPRSRLNRLLRHPYFITMYQKILPRDAGLSLMKFFSRFMRRSEEYSTEAKILNEWAESMFYSSNTDIIICGHDHHPRICNFDFGTFVNLGTFYQHQTVAVYNNGTFSLVTWNEESRELKPFYPDRNLFEQ